MRRQISKGVALISIAILATVVITIVPRILQTNRGSEGFQQIQWVQGAAPCQWNVQVGYNDPSCYGKDSVTDRDEEARQRGVQWNTELPLECLGIPTPWIIWTGLSKNGLPLKCFLPEIPNTPVVKAGVPKTSPSALGSRVTKAVGWEPSTQEPLDTIVMRNADGSASPIAGGGTGSTTTTPTTTTPATPASTVSQSTSSGGSGFAAKDFMNQPNRNNLILTFIGFLLIFLYISVRIAKNVIDYGNVPFNDFLVFVISGLFGWLGAFIA
jgi:hypothetical protein